jgi:hypothetical protein
MPETLSLAMHRRLADGPQELRQAYVRLILERVTVDHDVVRQEGSPAVLEKLANRGPSKSTPEVLSFVQEWRAGGDSNLNWEGILPLPLLTAPALCIADPLSFLKCAGEIIE